MRQGQPSFACGDRPCRAMYAGFLLPEFIAVRRYSSERALFDQTLNPTPLLAFIRCVKLVASSTAASV